MNLSIKIKRKLFIYLTGIQHTLIIVMNDSLHFFMNVKKNVDVKNGDIVWTS